MYTETTKLVKRKKARTTKLIAEFEADGFAKGWSFKVHKAFKEALDIRETDKVIKDKNGKKRTIKQWTQGIAYNFNIGDTFHNNKDAYDDWKSFVKNGGITLQIESATSSGYELVLKIKDDGNIERWYKYNSGYITLHIYTDIGNGYEKVLEYDTTAVELINILKNGLNKEVLHELSRRARTANTLF